jgi:uncharacterized membrane protein YgaE (UPF0421/DUF939 family)
LRRVGVGERVLKTALAVGLAWELGALLPVEGGPYLAPLAALLTMQVTVADSLSAAAQRLLGIVVGVVVAIGVTAVVGISGPTVGLLIGLALAVGSVLRMPAPAVQQVAVSALLLIAVGTVSSVGYAVARILETLVGAAVGVAVNAVLAPPSHLVAARTAVIAHAAGVAAALDGLAALLSAGVDATAANAALDAARASDVQLRAAQAAVEQTETAHRFNLWNRHERPDVARLARSLRAQERVAMQARGVVRTINDAVAREPSRPPWLAPDAFAGNLWAAMSAAATVLHAFPEAMIAGPDSAAGIALVQAAEDMATNTAGIAATPDIPVLLDAGQQWVPLGSVIADLDRIRRELVGGLAERDDAAQPPPATAPSDGVVDQ